MTLPDQGPAVLREVEKIVDVGFDVGHAWLALWQAWARVCLRPLSALDYSVAAEAAELLRQRQGDGGPSDRRPAHRSED